MLKCPICLTSIISEKRKVLPCEHQFCQECISNWFKENKHEMCPVCRNVPTKVPKKNQTITRSMSRRILSNWYESHPVHSAYGMPTTYQSYDDFGRIISMDDDDDDDIIYNELLQELELMVTNDINGSNLLTRSETFALRKQTVIGAIKQCLKNIEADRGVDRKIATTNEIFNIIKANKWLLTNYDHFRQTVINKLIELHNDRRVILHSEKWFFDLFEISIGDYIANHCEFDNTRDRCQR